MVLRDYRPISADNISRISFVNALLDFVYAIDSLAMMMSADWMWVTVAKVVVVGGAHYDLLNKHHRYEYIIYQNLPSLWDGATAANGCGNACGNCPKTAGKAAFK